MMETNGMNIPPWLEGQVRALIGIAEAMRTTLGYRDVLGAMLRCVVEHLHYKAALLRLLDADRRTLVLEQAFGLSQAYLTKGIIEVDKSILDRDVLAGKPVQIRDSASEPGLQYPEAARREGIYSVLALPLSIRGQFSGVLRVYTGEPHDFTPEERAFLTAVANLMARAIATARLFQAFQKLAREVNSSLKLGEVLERLLRGTTGELNYKAGLIRLIDPERQVMRLVAAVGLSADYLGKGDVRVSESAVDREILQGRPVTILDAPSDPSFQYGEAAAREGIRSVQALPLAVNDAVIGVLRVYSSQPHRFTDEEIAFLSAIADLGAVAIENARMHEALSEKYETLKTDSAGWYRFLTLS
jgi:signal transduction protein with GAF and PtsI domain